MGPWCCSKSALDYRTTTLASLVSLEPLWPSCVCVSPWSWAGRSSDFRTSWWHWYQARTTSRLFSLSWCLGFGLGSLRLLKHPVSACVMFWWWSSTTEWSELSTDTCAGWSRLFLSGWSYHRSKGREQCGIPSWKPRRTQSSTSLHWDLCYSCTS